MARTKIVEIRGIDAMRERLRPGRMLSPVKTELVKAAAMAARLTAMRASKGKAGKGTLGKHIHIEFLKKGMVARISPTRRVIGIASVIEYGRRPGRRPPYTPLKLWAARAGVKMSVRDLQQEIKERGTRGVFFMEAAQEAANKVIKGGIPKTEAEIKALWERPGV